jgi:formylglycine-generating enzyme
MVAVGDFWIDAHTVTNAELATFVAATGYETVAERPLDPGLYPGCAAGAAEARHGGVLRAGRRGGHERDPQPLALCARRQLASSGRSDQHDRCELEPVVQVALEHAIPYAAWAGKEVPSEAEWEFAAPGAAVYMAKPGRAGPDHSSGSPSGRADQRLPP